MSIEESAHEGEQTASWPFFFSPPLPRESTVSCPGAQKMDAAWY